MKINRLRLQTALLITFASLVLSTQAAAQTYPPVWTSTSSYVAGDIVQYGGNWYRATKALAAHGPYPASGFGSWELNYVRSNTTLVIGLGQTFSSLQNAWGFALEARVADGAYLHLSISTANGELLDTFTGQFSLDHQSGSRISIIGDDKNSIVLGGNNGFPGNGLLLDSGHTLASLSNVTLYGQGINGQGSGLLVTTNASLSCTGVQVTNFEIDVNASQGASVTLDSTSGTTSSHLYTIEASTNASVVLQGGFSCTNSTGDFILYATSGGQIIASECSLDGVGTDGVYAEYGGKIDVSYGTVSNCFEGMVAIGRSFIYAEGATVSGNTTDLVVAANGVIYAVDITSPKVSADSGTGSYIIQ